MRSQKIQEKGIIPKKQISQYRYKRLQSIIKKIIQHHIDIYIQKERCNH